MFRGLSNSATLGTGKRNYHYYSGIDEKLKAYKSISFKRGGKGISASFYRAR